MAFSASNAFEEKVQLHFTQGISSLDSLAKCLVRVQGDPSIFAELTNNITRASKELAEAEALTEQEVERVNVRILEIMELKNKLTGEKKRRKEDLGACNIHLWELGTLRNESTKNVFAKQNMKMYAKVEQRRAEMDGVLHRRVRNAALLSMWVPGVGTLIGGAMAIKAHGDMKEAKARASSAQDRAERYKGKEKEYYQEAEKYTQLLKEQESKIQENQRKVEEIEEERCTLVKLQEETLDLQESLRNCAHFVGMLASKVSAAEITTCYIFVYESLRNQLEDMRKHMAPLQGRKSIKIRGLSILSSPRVKETVQKLKCF